MKKEGNNGMVLVIVLFIGAILVFLFPVIHKVLTDATLPSVEKGKDTEEKKEEKVLTQEIIDEIHIPIMRTSSYQEFTYYSLPTFKITDMSNQDILYNAFMDIYEGNIVDSDYKSNCTNVRKEFSSKYIDLRIKNILGRNLKYELEDFYVPADSGSNYVGKWVYNNDKFYYYGECSIIEPNAVYHDVTSMINAKYDDDDIVITYYVGFVKVEGNNYTIYSDANMKNVIYNGTGKDYESAFNNLNDSLKKKYQITYKNTICTYDEYCLYEGKWL